MKINMRVKAFIILVGIILITIGSAVIRDRVGIVD